MTGVPSVGEEKMSNVQQVIKDVLDQEFEGVVIKSIELREAADFEDDSIFYVTVVFESAGPLNRRATTGLVRHLRPKLHEAKEDRFPVISFVSSEDYGELAEAC